MVELRGVEPLSERRPAKASPSAVCTLVLARAAAANGLRLCQALHFPFPVRPRRNGQPILMTHRAPYGRDAVRVRLQLSS